MIHSLTPILVLVWGLALFGCAVSETEEPTSSPWQVDDLGTNAEFRDIYFLDAKRGWIVGGGIEIEGGIVGYTTDGGASWRFQSGIVRPSRRATSFHLNAVWFLDETRGFIAADGDHLLGTVDGGRHWHDVAPANRVWAHIFDVQFAGDLAGWALGSGGMLRTTDGGKHWTPATPRGKALHFVDREHGWLVGSSGLIRASVDGGLTWENVPSPSEESLRDVEFADSTFGWSVGDKGTILNTSDGGKTWRRQTSGVQHTLMAVDFVDPRQGWVVGFSRASGNSVVLATMDGGETWSRQATVPSEGLRALFALDNEQIWAVGEQQRRSPEDGPQKLLRYRGAESVE